MNYMYCQDLFESILQFYKDTAIVEILPTSGLYLYITSKTLGAAYLRCNSLEQLLNSSKLSCIMYDFNFDFCLSCTHLCEIKFYNLKHIEHFC